MNRICFNCKNILKIHLPHIRGDEPFTPFREHSSKIIYPTYVGMNRHQHYIECCLLIHLPHIRGDEPLRGWVKMDEKEYLPHIRGDEPKKLLINFLTI